MSNLDDINPYAEWLEEICRTIAKYQPKQIGVAMECDDCVVSDYWGGAKAYDKMHLGDILRSDGTMDMVLANADMVADAAEELMNNDDDDDAEDDSIDDG